MWTQSPVYITEFKKAFARLSYFAIVQPLFPLYKIVSDYKDKFQIENFSEIQDEHKIFPWLQTVITRKLLYMEYKHFFFQNVTQEVFTTH